jgi:hypothetical protein
MKLPKNIIAGAILFSGLFAFTASASAEWYNRRDQRELAEARRELRQDLRRGAGPAEIARDRAAVARERGDLWNDNHYRYDNDRYYDRWDDRRGWWNRGWWWGR